MVSSLNYWPKKTFIVFDTETTGLDFQNDHIIQLAISVFHDRMNIWNFNWYSNTPRRSHPDAFKTHQISDEWRWEYGVSPQEIVNHVTPLFARMRERGLPILAFNAPFDFSMLRAEYARQSRNFSTDNLFVIDPIVIDRHYQKNIPVFQAPWMRLSYMAARYGISPPNHNAEQDAICTGKVAMAQSLSYPYIRKNSPKQLHQTQQVWFAEWVDKVKAFSNKKNFSFSTPSWPFGD